MRNILSALLLIAAALPAFSQEADTSRKMITEVLDIHFITGEVVGILEGNEKLAVIKLLENKDDACNLKQNDEILVSFYFGTFGRKSDPVLESLKPGDIIQAELYCKPHVNNVQMDYTVFRYFLQPPLITE